MNCPSCGAPMHLDPDKDFCQCDYCKGYYFPDQNEEGVRVFGEQSALACPLCAIPLSHATMGGIRFLYCGHCRGMLISMEVFAELIVQLRSQLGVRQAIPKPPDASELDRRISCPQCHAHMDTHRYGGPGNIIIDSCSKCLYNWLDHGELMRVVHTADHALRIESEMA
jgi:Zn-finger nucleic acid-binding protein